MNLRSFARRAALAFVLVAGAFWIVPAAFAGVHVGIGVGVYGPGYAVGVNSGCWRCGYYGYVAPRVYYPAPAYYPPAYYPAPVYYGPSYYGPAYYGPRPIYYGYGYHGRRWHRSWRRGGRYYGRGYHGGRHGYGHGGGYYHRGHR